MSHIDIRKCNEEEILAVGQFYDEVVSYLDHHINYPLWIYKVYPSGESVRAMTAKGSQYICKSDDGIEGAFVLSSKPSGNYGNGNWSKDLSCGSYLVVKTLAVRPSNQGQGIASGILDFCIDEARKGGYKALRADIVPTNTPSRKLFEKKGFVYAGDADLELGIEQIPCFSLYELNLC